MFEFLNPSFLCRSRENIVNYLLDNTNNFDSCNFQGESPLVISLREGNVNTARYLLNHNFSYDKEQINYYGMLHSAVEAGALDIAEKLLQLNPNLGLKNIGGENVFQIAVHNNDSSMLKLLMKQAHKTNMLDFYVNNALILSVAEGKTQALSALLEGGASPQSRDIRDKTALGIAFATSNLEAIDILLPYVNIDKDYIDDNHLLVYAGGIKERNFIQDFLEKGANVNVKDDYGKTPLHLAAAVGSQKNILQLLEAGADILATSRSQRNVLHYAAEFNYNKSIISFLLEKGANPNLKDNQGFPPLEIALSNSNEAAILELMYATDIQKFAFLMNRETDSTQPLWLTYAAKLGNTEIFDYLVKNGALLYYPPSLCYCSNPLETAAFYGQEDILDYYFHTERKLTNLEGVLNCVTNSSEPKIEIIKKILDYEGNLSEGGIKKFIDLEFFLNVCKTPQTPERLQVANYLVKLINPHAENIEQYFQTLAIGGTPEIADTFLKLLYKNYPNLQLDDFSTALVSSIYANNIPMLEWFLKHGGKPGFCLYGKNAWEVAAYENNLEAIKVLKKFSGKIEGEWNRDIPLVVALKYKHKEMAEELAEITYISKKDIDKGYLLHKAAATGSTNLVNKFLKEEANLYSIDDQGRNVLHKAAEGCNLDIIKKFHDLGVDLEANDNSGNTVFFLAAQNCDII